MVQPRKWFWGLVPLLLLGILGGYWQQSDLESELQRRGTVALGAAGAGWAKAALSGRDAVLSGQAPSPEAKAQAVKALEGVAGIRRISDASSLLAEAKPFNFIAMRDGVKMSLSGFVPGAAQRAALIEAAKKSIPGAVIIDETRDARGAPGEFAALASFGLAQLTRLSQGTMRITDQQLSLTGRAADFDAFNAIHTGLATLPAGATLGRGLGTGDILPPLIKPFTFEAMRDGNVVTLSGYVPSAEIRQRLLADLRPQVVKDQLKVADGAPVGDWAAFAGGGLAALGKLSSGKLTIVDEKLLLSGKAPEGLGLESLRAMLASLPGGFSLARLDVEETLKVELVASPFVFEAERGEKSLRLNGVVADEKSRHDILALAARLFEGDKVDATLTLGAVPKDAGGLIAGGLQLLSRLAPGGKLSLDSGAITLQGLAYFDSARDAVAEEFRRLVPPGFAGTADVGTAQLAPAVSAEECQALFNDILTSGKVRFKVASAALNEESRGILDRLAVVALRCGEARLEIGGHTDSDGSAEDNAELSRRRAETVALYFTQAGIPASRLEPVGFGANKPVAPNDSPENKAKNRRIEFIVK